MRQSTGIAQAKRCQRARAERRRHGRAKTHGRKGAVGRGQKGAVEWRAAERGGEPAAGAGRNWRRVG